MIYPKEMLEIYTSAELNALGRRYHDILVETGKGIVKKDRENNIIKDDRTKEQINLVNKIVTSMLPVIEQIALSLTNLGRYQYLPINLEGIDFKRMKTQIADIANEGARCIVERFHIYDPYRIKKGSVYSFVISMAGAGMATYILKNIPNSTAVFNRIKQQRANKRLSKKEVFNNLPYIYHVSLTDLLYGDEDGIRNVSLERKYLTSENNPEEDFISIKTEEHIPRIVEDLLSTLNPREREILERRNGLNGYREMSLKELGRIFGITMERVRQIEVKTLKKLGKTVSKELVELVR